MIGCMKKMFILAILGIAPSWCIAQDDHGHSDIEFGYADGKIEVETGAEGAVFEGTFPLDGVERLFTTEPGFASEIAEGLGIGPSDQIVYDVLGPLRFWNNGFQPVPAGVHVRIVNLPPAPTVPDTIVSGSSLEQLGGFAPFRNRVGQADETGDFHADLEFYFESETNPSIVPESWHGAYGMPLRLATDAQGIDPSEPFYLVFNLGLEDETFETGVASFAALVPEPSGMALLGALVLFGSRRKMRRDLPTTFSA